METGGFLPNCISTLQESLIRHLKVSHKHLSFLEERQKLIRVSVARCLIEDKFFKCFLSRIDSLSDREMTAAQEALEHCRILACQIGSLWFPVE
jgi:hypothetical protein